MAQAVRLPILVTGATGYIGGRLIPYLLEAGYHVRAVARNPAKLQSRSWVSHDRLEVAQADMFDLDSLREAARGCHAAYYLVHSMNPQSADFAEADRVAARHMATAASEAGLEQIIYLSGLGEQTPDLSKHLRSRAEVAKVLREGPVPATVLRAAMIIGSGSASFEILRYLVDRLPIMVTPRWVDTPCQPIAIRNVLNYLVGCLEVPETRGQVFDIGQPEVVTYRDLMGIYAEEAGLRPRWVIPVPVLTPRLSSYWIHLVTPVPASIARPLAEGLRNEVICHDNRIRELIPQELLDCRLAIRRALESSRQQQVESSWVDAGYTPPVEWRLEHDPQWSGGTVFEDQRKLVVHESLEHVWRAVCHLDESPGRLWRLRALVDRLVGGVGAARRRRGDALSPGDVIDSWRVLEADPPHRLLLLSEMKLPGEATLEFQINDSADGGVEVRQLLRFVPRGLGGIVYWYLAMPFHAAAFGGLLKGVSQQASVHGGGESVAS